MPYNFCAGVYYWLWLDPEWRLMAFPEYAFLPAKMDSHADVWPICAREATIHYKLTPEEGSELENLLYAFPRGRVALSIHTRASPVRYFAYHGNDSPIRNWLPAISRAFALDDKDGGFISPLDAMYDEHEIMQEDDRERLRQLGIMPPPPQWRPPERE